MKEANRKSCDRPGNHPEWRESPIAIDPETEYGRNHELHCDREASGCPIHPLRVAAMIGATPIPRYEVVPSLIGGLVIQDGDNLYDASIKTKLDRMKRVLIEGKGRDITTPILVD